MTQWATNRWSRAIVLIGLLATLALIIRCGRRSVTPSTTAVPGLPPSWNGSADYQAEGWRFETQ